MRFAKSCSDHLAENLDVRLATALVQLQDIECTSNGFALLDKGEIAFVALGID